MGLEKKALSITRKWLIGILIFVIVNILLTDVSPIEFRDIDIKDEYHLTLIFATPLIVFLLVILDYLKNQKNRIFMLNFILGIPLAITSFVLVVLIYGSIDFSRGDEKVLFQNRFKPKQQIVYRTSYWNGDQRDGKTLRLVEINRYFQLSQVIDTASLNPYKWISQKNQTPN